MTQPIPPRAFISHASEDKARFVEDFALQLRQHGVDAWLDKWEMLPGDKLIEKIFHEGIRNSDVVIIVLSQYSIKKPWVREEIDAAFMKRLEGKVRIIPVIIDECEVPEELRATLYERVDDLSDYAASVRRIVASIFGTSEKPPLGTPPRHTQLPIDHIPGLSSIDTTILKVACEVTLDTDYPIVQPGVFLNRLQELEISEEEVHESLQILEDRYLIDASWAFGPTLVSVRVTPRGFENYGRFFIPGFNDLVNQTLLAIVNYDLGSNEAVASHLGKPRRLTEYVLDLLHDRKLIKVRKYGGRNVLIDVLPQGKRYAEQIGR